MAVTGIDQKVITQVCIIVDDVALSADRYRRVLGWDIPDMYQITRLSDHTEATYYGEPTDARALISGFDIGGIQFELLQPMGPPSSWQDYLDKHGEGIHHIAFFVPKTKLSADSFLEHGYQITQQGLFTRQTGMYTYLDTDKDLGVVIELLEHFGGSPTPKGSPFPPDKGLGTDIVSQVGIIVNDVESTAKQYEDILGIPVQFTVETPGYAQSKTLYKGQPSEATAKLAFFNTGQVQIELIQPDEHPSVWRDYLDTKGEGAQHIAIPVKNTKVATDYLATLGIEVIQQGLYADGSGMYTYVDTDAMLGTTIELLENY